MTAIRKGDLIAVVVRRNDYFLGEGVVERCSVELGRCESATRDGAVKTWAPVWRDEAGPRFSAGGRRRPGETYLLIEDVDAGALLGAYAARRWHDRDDGGFPPPFSSIEECRDFCRAFRVVTA